MVSGKAYYAIDHGFIAQVKLKKAAVGLDDDHHVEVNLTRTPGNTTDVTPTNSPAPGDMPANLVKGKVLFPSPPQVLGPGDNNNYPEKPGCFFKTFPLKLVAGKTYIIEMNKIDQSALDPYLILVNALGQKLADDNDGGGDLNAKIIYQAPVTGNYQVLATSLAANMTGQFQLIVSEAAGAPKANIPKGIAPKAPAPNKKGQQKLPKVVLRDRLDLPATSRIWQLKLADDRHGQEEMFGIVDQRDEPKFQIVTIQA